MYRIVFKKAAAKALLKMPKPMAEKFLTAFEQLADNPKSEELDLKPLSGRDGYRLRIGQWRAIYRIEDERLVIEVLKIGPRGDVYK
jgi:mRNA interferase RelE/StbE